MSEHQENLHDSNTPEDKLIRYRWLLSAGNEGLESLDGDVEQLYRGAILGLQDLLEAHGITAPVRRDAIIGELLPGPFDLRGLEFDDWMIQLRLAPVRLLDRELPPLETYTGEYLREVFATALSGEADHSAQRCTDGEPIDKVECATSLTCPALVTRGITLRRLGVLFFDLHTYDKSQANDIERTEEAIQALSFSLTRYELIDDMTIGIIRSEMNKAAQDFFSAIATPRHRRTD